jgi:parallel beta-helix repeat protein
MFNRTLLRAIVVLLAAVVVQQASPAEAVQQDGCTSTLSPGQSVDDAVRQGRDGTIICLRSGIYAPLSVGSTAPSGVTVRAVSDGVNIVGTRTQPAVSIEADRFTLSGVVVREGVPMTVRATDAEGLVFRNVRVEGASVGVVLDMVTMARLEDVSINAPVDAGLVVARRSSVTAERLTVTGGGIGVAALPEGTSLTLRGGKIEGGHGPAIHAGALGCADVTAATVEVPACYYDDAARYVSSVRVLLADVTVDDGPGAGVVLFPGVTAQLNRTNIFGRGRGGVLAWGAELTATDSLIEANWEYGIALRGYPHAGTQGFPRASGQLLRTTVRSTRSLSARIGGNGVIAAGAQLSLRESALVWNDSAGIAMTEASSGELRDNTVIENHGVAICISADSSVQESGNRLSGNQQDLVLTCGRAIGDSTAVGSDESY